MIELLKRRKKYEELKKLELEASKDALIEVRFR